MSGTDKAETTPPRAGRVARYGWVALVLLLPALAMRGALTTSELFYLRDLASYYWPQTLWLRATVAAGELPLWDPGLALGQPAVADPVRQLFFLPTLPLRLLLPDVVGFNLSVALPFPTAALGAFLFLRRRVTPPAAALGALAFALSGPLLSTGNLLNHSWTAAFLPWVLWGVDRLADRPETGGLAGVSVGRVSVLAALFCLQALAGEAVTLVATAALAVAYAAFGAAAPARDRLRLVVAVCAAGLAGMLLAAPQLLPMAAALRGTDRGAGAIADGWSIHPLTLFETAAPALFGDPFANANDASPWIPALNGGREPYLFSVYAGAATLVLALAGAATRALGRRWPAFWVAVLAVSTVCALGYNTPVYPVLRAVLPPLRSARFPAKYAVFAALAVAVLCASGWHALASRPDSERRRIASLAAGGAVAALFAGVAAWAALSPTGATDAFARLAVALGVSGPTRAGELLAQSVAAGGLRAAVLVGAALACVLVGGSTSVRAPLARSLLFGLIAADLLAANWGLSPTMRASLLREPSWVAATREHPGDRVYIGRGDSFTTDADAVDAPPPGLGNPAVPVVTTNALKTVVFSRTPSAWGLREVVSVDLTRLLPREYTRLQERFQRADRESRRRYLARAGTRYYVTAAPPFGPSRRIMSLPGLEPVAVYETDDAAPRASVVPAARVLQAADAQTALMFDARFDPSAEVLLEGALPPAAGASGAPTEASARVVGERSSAVTIEATAPEGGGYLVLRDSYSPDWKATVDGAPADVLRADGLFRAVRLAPGAHHVAFEYRPNAVYVGLGISAATALMLLGGAAFVRRGAASREGSQRVDST